MPHVGMHDKGQEGTHLFRAIRYQLPLLLLLLLKELLSSAKHLPSLSLLPLDSILTQLDKSTQSNGLRKQCTNFDLRRLCTIGRNTTADRDR